MPANEKVVVERPPADPAENLKAQLELKLGAAIEVKRARAQAEIAQAPFPDDWEVLAWGPWQSWDTYSDPGRIVFVGEQAIVATAVILSPDMATRLAGFGADIQLSYWTSNTQTMQPVPNLSQVSCIDTASGYWVYWDYYIFTPDTAACLYEMNICARVCNCDHLTVPGYAAFVRHVFDFDPEHLWPPTWSSPGWQFDRPIRFMVADPQVPCCQ